MKQLELLKAKIEILTKIPDHYDLATALLIEVSKVEQQLSAHLKLEMDKFSASATNTWVDVMKGATKYAVYNSKAYKITAAPLETIPQGENTLYITEIQHPLP